MAKPKPPEHLNDREVAIWKETLPKIARPTELQVDLLAAYAREKARWLEATEWLDENGLTVIFRTDKGDPKMIVEAPQVKIAERALKSFLDIATQLGLDKKRIAKEP